MQLAGAGADRKEAHCPRNPQRNAAMIDYIAKIGRMEQDGSVTHLRTIVVQGVSIDHACKVAEQNRIEGDEMVIHMWRKEGV